MRILVIGGGGREHALVWKLAQSKGVSAIFCAPGNPGMAPLAQCVNLGVEDHEALAAFAKENDIGLTVVGPEGPLVAGIVDFFAAKGLRAFGPSQAAARLEGSKQFAKEIMAKYGIPTADFAVFTDAEAAKEYVRKNGAPIVVKADGLAAGKGVVVAMSEAEAIAAIDDMLCQGRFGSAGNRVVLEEFMQGEEASLLAFADGETVVPMVAAQDHKRIFDGDQGPNTGGMGAYAPAPVATESILKQTLETVLQPMVKAMAAEGCPYKGVLYAGLMITDKGPRVVEFNARFGDPETQVVLPLLESDLVEIMLACIDGTLAKTEVKWKQSSTVCVVMAAGGYPESYRKGDVIRGLAEAAEAGTVVFHAGTGLSADGEIVTAGGRVLGVTASGADIAGAVAAAYKGVACISFEGVQYRKDIAYRALARR